MEEGDIDGNQFDYISNKILTYFPAYLLNLTHGGGEMKLTVTCKRINVINTLYLGHMLIGLPGLVGSLISPVTIISHVWLQHLYFLISRIRRMLSSVIDQ